MNELTNFQIILIVVAAIGFPVSVVFSSMFLLKHIAKKEAKNAINKHKDSE